MFCGHSILDGISEHPFYFFIFNVKALIVEYIVKTMAVFEAKGVED